MPNKYQEESMRRENESLAQKFDPEHKDPRIEQLEREIPIETWVDFAEPGNYDDISKD